MKIVYIHNVDAPFCLGYLFRFNVRWTSGPLVSKVRPRTLLSCFDCFLSCFWVLGPSSLVFSLLCFFFFFIVLVIFIYVFTYLYLFISFLLFLVPCYVRPKLHLVNQISSRSFCNWVYLFTLSKFGISILY